MVPKLIPLVLTRLNNEHSPKKPNNPCKARAYRVVPEFPVKEVEEQSSRIEFTETAHVALTVRVPVRFGDSRKDEEEENIWSRTKRESA